MSIFENSSTRVTRRRRVRSQGAAFTIDVPANCAVSKFYIRNNTANAITGGLKIGTTLGGTDIVAAQPISASNLYFVNPTTPAINTAGVRTLYFDAVTAWNAAVIDLVVEYVELS
jgi:hypothetical protein